MSNISDYIKSNKKLKSLDFLTVYLTIIELIKDGKIELKNNVWLTEIMHHFTEGDILTLCSHQ